MNIQGTNRVVLVLARLSVLICMCLPEVSFAASEFHIQVQGDEVSLRTALMEARAHRQESPQDKIVINLPPTVIRLASPLEIMAADSGTDNAPLIIRGAASGGTKLKGSKLVPRQLLRNLPSEERRKQFDNADGPIVEFDFQEYLSGVSITKRGMEVQAAQSQFEIFRNGRRLNLSRWPHVGFSREVASYIGQADRKVHLKFSSFLYDAIKQQDGVWIGGFWNADWKYEMLPLSDLLQEDRHEFIVPSEIRFGKQNSFRFSLLNVLQFLHKGEYALDLRRKRAFVFGELDDSYEVATAVNVIRISGARNVRIENVAVEQALGNAVQMKNAEDVSFENCFIGNAGLGAVSIDGGRRNKLWRCIIAHVAETGVHMAGGDERTLARGDHSISETLIEKFGQENPSYRPGVRIRGVGNSVSKSVISEGAHAGIILDGIDHTVIENDISHVGIWTDDVGAIYMGRNWTSRGNLLSKNYIHDIGNDSMAQKLVAGIYLDDQFSGAEISENTFERCPISILIGGGKDNFVHDNIFRLSGQAAIRVDARGLTWQGQNSEAGQSLTRTLELVLKERPEVMRRFPEIRTDEMVRWAPIGNRLIRNIAVGGEISSISKEAEDYIYLSDNQKRSVDPFHSRVSASRAELVARSIFGSMIN